MQHPHPPPTPPVNEQSTAAQLAPDAAGVCVHIDAATVAAVNANI